MNYLVWKFWVQSHVMSVLPENLKHRIVEPIEFRYNIVNGTLRYKAPKSNLTKE